MAQTSSLITVRAFAKINWTLDVFSKRADGFHSLASVMQTLSLHDTLTLEATEEPGIAFSCEAPDSIPVPNDPTNLVYRAAQRLLEEAKVNIGVRIHLQKRIPSQAGLGGGSSDASATLVGLNALLGLDWHTERLRPLAAELGSDVPFFLTGGTATARGRGEKITPIADAPTVWLAVVKPDVGVSTGWAYGALDAIAERVSHRATQRFQTALEAGDFERFIAWQSNDFELPVFQEFSTLAWLHDELRMAGALTAHLCGSGSALYGVVRTEAEAERIVRILRGKYPHAFVAQTLSRHEANPLATE